MLLTHGPALLVANQGAPMTAEVVIESLGHIGASDQGRRRGDRSHYATEDGETYQIGGVTEYLSRFNLVSKVLDMETASI